MFLMSDAHIPLTLRKMLLLPACSLASYLFDYALMILTDIRSLIPFESINCLVSHPDESAGRQAEFPTTRELSNSVRVAGKLNVG